MQFSRTIGLTALVLWVGSLFSYTIDYRLGFAPSDKTPGFETLAIGWMLPLVSVPAVASNPLAIISCFAWYANLPFLLSVYRLLRGGYPKLQTITVGFALALTALAPIYTASEADMKTSGPGEYIRGPAFWMWLISFAVIWFPTFYAKVKADKIS